MAVAETLFKKEEEALLREWRRVEAKLQRLLRSVKATDFTRQRSQVLLQQVQTIITDLEEGTDRWLDRTLPKAFEAGFNWKGAGIKPADFFPAGDFAVFASIPKMAVDAVILSIATDCKEALASVAPNLGSVFTYSQQAIATESALMEQVAQNLIEGKGPQALAREIVRTLKDGALGRLDDYLQNADAALTSALKAELQQTAAGRYISIHCKDGKIRRYGLRNYSEMVARTSTRMAQTEGTLQSCAQLHIDLVQVSVHANPCEAICSPLQGKVYSVSGQHPDFPPLSSVGRPPYHPHCRHVLLSAPEEYLRGRGVYDALRDFSQSERQVADAYGYRDLLAGAAA